MGKQICPSHAETKSHIMGDVFLYLAKERHLSALLPGVVKVGTLDIRKMVRLVFDKKLWTL